MAGLSALAICRRNLGKLALALSEKLGLEALALRKPFYFDCNRIDCLLELPESIVDLFQARLRDSGFAPSLHVHLDKTVRAATNDGNDDNGCDSGNPQVWRHKHPPNEHYGSVSAKVPGAASFDLRQNTEAPPRGDILERGNKF